MAPCVVCVAMILSGALSCSTHFASALITKKVIVAFNGLETPAPHRAGKRHILLYTPTGEFHEIPLLYMRYLMKKNGAATIYFGSNVAIDNLRHYCKSRPVTHLYFHLVTHLLHCEPDQYLRRLTDAFPETASGTSGAEVRRSGRSVSARCGRDGKGLSHVRHGPRIR